MVYYTYTIPCAFGVIGNFAANQLEDDMTEVIVMESVAYQKMMGQIARLPSLSPRMNTSCKKAIVTMMFGSTARSGRYASYQYPDTAKATE
mgnify:CR=1 FL=1